MANVNAMLQQIFIGSNLLVSLGVMMSDTNRLPLIQTYVEKLKEALIGIINDAQPIKGDHDCICGYVVSAEQLKHASQALVGIAQRRAQLFVVRKRNVFNGTWLDVTGPISEEQAYAIVQRILVTDILGIEYKIFPHF